MSQDYLKTEEIDGHKFEIYMLPPKAALSTLTELGKMLGPALGALSDGKDDAIGDVIKIFFDNVDNPKLISIMDRMADKTIVDGKPLKGSNFDSLFMGKIGLMFKWFIFALRSQYADFLEETTGLLGLRGLGHQTKPQ
jgi:hypothetical protein